MLHPYKNRKDLCSEPRMVANLSNAKLLSDSDFWDGKDLLQEVLVLSAVSLGSHWSLEHIERKFEATGRGRTFCSGTGWGSWDWIWGCLTAVAIGSTGKNVLTSSRSIPATTACLSFAYHRVSLLVFCFRFHSMSSFHAILCLFRQQMNPNSTPPHSTTANSATFDHPPIINTCMCLPC